MKTSDDIVELATALVAFQADVKDPVKTRSAEIKSERTGKTFSYKYVDLADVLEAVRPALKTHGLAIAQELVTDNAGQVGATTLIMHTSGQYLVSGPVFVPAGDDARDTGKAATYARRYSMLAALNMAAADDDAATSPPKRPGSAGAHKASGRQLGKIRGEAERAGLNAQQLMNAVKRDYSAAELEALTKDQAGELIERLMALSQKPATTAPNVDTTTGEVASDADKAPGMDGDQYRAANAANAEQKAGELDTGRLGI